MSVWLWVNAAPRDHPIDDQTSLAAVALATFLDGW